jgi:hypothetical protein
MRGAVFSYSCRNWGAKSAVTTFVRSLLILKNHVGMGSAKSGDLREEMGGGWVDLLWSDLFDAAAACGGSGGGAGCSFCGLGELQELP